MIHLFQMYSPAVVFSLTEGYNNFPEFDVSSIQSWQKSPLFPFCLPLPFFSLLLVYSLLDRSHTANMQSFRQQVEGGGSRVCGEADQHIKLNKLMSQCQFATERSNSPKTSMEVRLITSFTAEPWLPGFSSRESVDAWEMGGKSKDS